MEKFNESVLDSSTDILPFNCEQSELDGFLFEDSKNYHRERLAKTYLWDNGNITVAYWSLLNDSLSIKDFSDDKVSDKALQKWYARVADTLSSKKQKKSYPAVKIGRLAVHKDYQGQGIGRDIIDLIIQHFTIKNISACKFITVDAIQSAIPFYQKYRFKFLTSKDRKASTRLMYYELKD